MSDTYFDGDHATPFQHGPEVPSFDQEKKCNIYTQTMRGLASTWSAAAFTLEGTNDSHLIEETQPSEILGDVVEWKRIFAELPPERDEWESYVYAYPYSGSSFGALPFPVQSRLHYDYFYTTAPDLDIETLRAYRIISVGGTLVYIGTAPAVDDTEQLAEDSTYKRWKGSNIYERTARYVPILTPTAV